MNPWNWILKILTFIFKQVSPDLRKKIVELLLQLKEYAKTTPNEWDNFFVDLLLDIFAVE